jgi:hypothetical protein
MSDQDNFDKLDRTTQFLICRRRRDMEFLIYPFERWHERVNYLEQDLYLTYPIIRDALIYYGATSFDRKNTYYNNAGDEMILVTANVPRAFVERLMKYDRAIYMATSLPLIHQPTKFLFDKCPKKYERRIPMARLIWPLSGGIQRPCYVLPKLRGKLSKQL